MTYNPDTLSFEVPDTGQGKSRLIRPKVYGYCKNHPSNNILDSCPADQVYVSGLPKDVTEEDIVEYFGSIGMLKIDKKRDLGGSKKKIWLYKDKASGELKV